MAQREEDLEAEPDDDETEQGQLGDNTFALELTGGRHRARRLTLDATVMGGVNLASDAELWIAESRWANLKRSILDALQQCHRRSVDARVVRVRRARVAVQRADPGRVECCSVDLHLVV